MKLFLNYTIHTPSNVDVGCDTRYGNELLGSLCESVVADYYGCDLPQGLKDRLREAMRVALFRERQFVKRLDDYSSTLASHGVKSHDGIVFDWSGVTLTPEDYDYVL